MLTLNDGRSELWQWDTGRKLTVDADCSQVHFSNKIFGRSIDVDVVDGVAIIPDILLQTDKDLNVWAFVGTAENGYTKISKTFKVNRRNKPADYVFTPPDQTSLEEIKEKIEYLESIQDPDAIKNAVEDYLEQNPVESPVQSVNGYTGKVELTAEDVGAISQDDLQEATNEALAQAKANGEFDGQPGNDYILTDDDKAEIAEMASELVEVPDGDLTGVVKSVNGQTPDENGNVEITIPDSGGNADQSGLSAEASALLITILRNGVYSTDQSANITALAAELSATEPEEPDEPVVPDEPDEPEKTLTSISATYSGGSVAVGTSVTALTGIVVTAHYSDGSTETVTGYTLSGTIVEGSNTVTVSYGGKTASFVVIGVSESGGESGGIVSVNVPVDEFKYGGIGEYYPYWRNNSTNRLTYIGTAVPVTAGKTYVVTPVYSVENTGMKYGVQYADKALVDAQSSVPDNTAKIDSGWILTETYEFSPTFDAYVWITFANPSGGDVDATKIVSVTVKEVS